MASNGDQQDRTVSQTVAEILAAQLAVDVTLRLLRRALSPFKLPGAAVKAAFLMAQQVITDPVVPGEGPVGTKVMKRAWRFRANYLMKAARRIGAGLSAGKPLAELVTKERRFMQMHLDAQRNRAQTARSVDAAVGMTQAITGRKEFRWRTMRDGKVSKDCAKYEGKVFSWNTPPVVHGVPTYPGAVHPHCRCVAEPVSVGQLSKTTGNLVLVKGGQW